MKAIVYLIGICIALALLKLALVVLLVATLLGIIIGLFHRPAETFGFLLFLLIASLANEHGGALLVVIGLIIVSGLVLPRRP